MIQTSKINNQSQQVFNLEGNKWSIKKVKILGHRSGKFKKPKEKIKDQNSARYCHRSTATIERAPKRKAKTRTSNDWFQARTPALPDGIMKETTIKIHTTLISTHPKCPIWVITIKHSEKHSNRCQQDSFRAKDLHSNLLMKIKMHNIQILLKWLLLRLTI